MIALCAKEFNVPSSRRTAFHLRYVIENGTKIAIEKGRKEVKNLAATAHSERCGSPVL